MKTKNALALAALFNNTTKKDGALSSTIAAYKKKIVSFFFITKLSICLLIITVCINKTQAQKLHTPQQNIFGIYQSLFAASIIYANFENTIAFPDNKINNFSHINLNASSDVAVTITVNNPTATAGSNVLFKITAINNGADVANNIIVTEILPNGFTYVAYTATGGAYNIVNGEWDINDIAAGDSETLTIIANVRATGSYLNTVSITATEPDPNPVNNTASITLTPSVGVPIFASGASSTRCQSGSTITYTANASNTTGISYSVSPLTAGSIDATTGQVIWNEAFSGSATIRASAAGLNGPKTSQHVVAVSALPVTSISYGGIPYCKKGNVAVILTGQTAGTFSASAGLSINAFTGAINLETSTQGTYEVTYTFSNGSCSGSTKSTIVINDIPTVLVTDPAFACSPSLVNITLPAITAGSTPGLTYTYFIDENALIALPNASTINTKGTYYIKGTTTAGCSDIKPVHTDIKSLAATLTSNSATVAVGSSFTLTTNADASYEISSWLPAYMFSNQNAKMQTVVLKDSSTTFTIIAVSEDGCKDTASVRVNLTGNAQDLFIPNAFTPDRDGKNDIFKVYGTTVIGAEIRIYTQWGGLIYETADNAKGWDGTCKGVPQPVGPYIYVVKVRTNNQDTFLKKGTINLIR